MKRYVLAAGLLTTLSFLSIGAKHSQAELDPVAKGGEVYQLKKCAMCHTIQGRGGKSGGELGSVGAKRDADWLKRFLMAPKSVLPTAKMPPFKGSPEELNALVAYLSSLK